ncbi:3'-5' exonuclease [Oecophyllibacter saccharovorans]|uniref:3'-5' exonuclease n=1 Tax=Oecophyllibacter saccharovorans TaxID=2558360 RepID=UPI0011713DB3|nr:3'-5' exonuclease [Oecophyllibacter saccharovorans]TPW35060.1 3'-5' exonuclease [Oecophyllibacter saccharovorans]
MALLFFDTETTGLPSARRAVDDPAQPHCVQLAAVLTDDRGEEISAINVLIRPEGWHIPSFVTRIHGITTEKAQRYGVREALAAELFHDLTQQADRVIGHNVAFDCRIMATMYARSGRSDWQLPSSQVCTMQAASAVLALPPTPSMLAKGRRGPKPPRLEECLWHFFGEKLVNAHDAMADVQACRRVYFHLRSLAENGS